MIRRVAIALILAALFAGIATRAGAATPEGPQLAIIAQQGPSSEVLATGPSGEDPRRLFGGPGLAIGERLSWSADGGLLAFATLGSKGQVVAVAAADGGDPRVFPRASLDTGDPVMSPNGRTVFFARGEIVKELPGREHYLVKGSIWSLDLADGSVRRRTEWRLGFPAVPSSISPDGSTLAATRYSRRRGFEAVALDLRSGRAKVLASEASDPTYSPDGSQIAFVRWKNWRASAVDDGKPPIDELRVTRVGTFPRSHLLLRRHNLLAWPSWDPSGSRLAFTSSHVVENGYSDPEAGNKMMAINADGTCLTRIFTDPEITVYGSAWQPGVGREAGPISC